MICEDCQTCMHYAQIIVPTEDGGTELVGNCSSADGCHYSEGDCE